MQRAGKPFDTAVMLDVIEHLEAPDRAVAPLHSALRPGGALLLTTGDWLSPLGRWMGPHWRLMTPPQHLWFFSVRSLTRLLVRHGFVVRGVSRPWKRVPLGLARVYSLLRRLGQSWHLPASLSRLGLPVNLFDALRILAVKHGP